MDSLPYGFVDQLCSILSLGQLTNIETLSAPKWTDLARFHQNKRRHFDVAVRVLYKAENGHFFGDRRYSIEIREVPTDRQCQKLVHATNLNVLKSFDQRFVRFRKMDIQGCCYSGGDFATNFEDAFDYVTSRLDSNSCLTVRSAPQMTQLTDQLLVHLKSENFLNFIGLELYNEGGDLCQKVLDCQVKNNVRLKEIALTGREDHWTNGTEKVSIKSFIDRKGPKTVRVLSESVLDPIDVYVEKWLLDATFDLQLAVGNLLADDQKWIHSVHDLGEDEDQSKWYGRIHPRNEKAAVLANTGYEDGMCWLWICFTADRESLPKSKRDILRRECVGKDRCCVRLSDE
ncbi:hypothetical protein QR680_007387 [Steinernema hermaphroditum]|uniref:F-box domain-containing protein n=1 Tax=Steinernema hermaphroditum TaxID=289476 RepID=A0AA39ID09_9BILA|nr:hypothetical protein QR680_007387 [Steinernema hermaphroditum]